MSLHHVDNKEKKRRLKLEGQTGNNVKTFLNRILFCMLFMMLVKKKKSNIYLRK
jgi:hypothetical protein